MRPRVVDLLHEESITAPYFHANNQNLSEDSNSSPCRSRSDTLVVYKATLWIQVYRYVCRGLFERHKQSFVMMLILKMLQIDGVIQSSDISLLLNGGAGEGLLTMCYWNAVVIASLMLSSHQRRWGIASAVAFYLLQPIHNRKRLGSTINAICGCLLCRSWREGRSSLSLQMVRAGFKSVAKRLAAFKDQLRQRPNTTLLRTARIT